ncbi:uncharacterized protein LOC144707197 [Wolffia australiana]
MRRSSRIKPRHEDLLHLQRSEIWSSCRVASMEEIRDRSSCCGEESLRQRGRAAKIVSIPVVFIGSEEEKQKPSALPSTAITTAIDHQSAVMTIQKVARGFLARRSVKIVQRLEAELEAIEESASRGEIQKERIRVSEALMALLFELDSVRGARDYRRRVIRRAIALQEAMEGIPERSEDVGGDRAGSTEGEAIESGEAGSVMVERVMEENRALQRLAAELRERSEAQFRVMSGLLDRVGRLERAVERKKTRGGRRRKRQAFDSKKPRWRKCQRSL